jgi:hypothetical protein
MTTQSQINPHKNEEFRVKDFVKMLVMFSAPYRLSHHSYCLKTSTLLLRHDFVYHP